jgi:hypothetical protein
MNLTQEFDIQVETSHSLDIELPQNKSLIIDDFYTINQNNLTNAKPIYHTKIVNNPDAETSGPMVMIKDEAMFDLVPKKRNSIAEIMNTKKKEFFEASQKWEGRVDNISDTGFTATVTDLTTKNLNDGFVEIDFEELNEDDRDLVREGAIFYWCVGHYTSHAGMRLSSSLIIFRRLPKISDNYSKRLINRAKHYFDFPAKPKE